MFEPMLETIPLSQEYLIVTVLCIVFFLIYFLFQDKLTDWIENTKHQLRKTLRTFVVKTHVSSDGTTIRTSEPSSFMGSIITYFDHLFLSPANEPVEYTDKEPDLLHDMEEYEYGGETDEESIGI